MSRPKLLRSPTTARRSLGSAMAMRAMVAPLIPTTVAVVAMASRVVPSRRQVVRQSVRVSSHRRRSSPMKMYSVRLRRPWLA